MQRNADDDADGIVGRGSREGARLFREWFDAAERAAAERGEPTAYVFVMGSLAELLRVVRSAARASPRSTRCRRRCGASRTST